VAAESSAPDSCFPADMIAGPFAKAERVRCDAPAHMSEMTTRCVARGRRHVMTGHPRRTPHLWSSKKTSAED
jgi:hypothetical protein